MTGRVPGDTVGRENVAGGFALAAGAPDLQSVTIEDPAVQAALQPWAMMECVQLSKGRKVAHLDSLNLGNQRIVRERQATAVQKIGVSPADFCTISASTLTGDIRFSEHCGAQGDRVFFMPEMVEYDIHIPAGCETFYVGFSQKEFLRGARALDPAFWERPQRGVMPLVARRSNALKDAVDLWLKSTRDAHLRGEAVNTAIMRRELLQTVLHIATTPTGSTVPSYKERIRALQIGRIVRDFVEDRPDSDDLPTIADICTALNVSQRTLQYAVREYVGLSPLAYLRVCRLNRARAALAAASPQDTTITQVAMRFGFLHLGRFAGGYRQMFGETPSETLAR
ncbi:AraC family transcriptional regulator [Labrenzia sp. 011]|uniref:AraC family transcriptional regulator n=1 Tax=Labrenzia sp. 011 TaxID=2171494 RepID=UPI000D50F7D2|nr:AraC family transcriptional regulator [Labrenzia sp. 011]PVB60961.1 hypothetical protein DCO57_14950 [Labrenzia sp. 011]